MSDLKERITRFLARHGQAVSSTIILVFVVFAVSLILSLVYSQQDFFTGGDDKIDADDLQRIGIQIGSFGTVFSVAVGGLWKWYQKHTETVSRAKEPVVAPVTVNVNPNIPPISQSLAEHAALVKAQSDEADTYSTLIATVRSLVIDVNDARKESRDALVSAASAKEESSILRCEVNDLRKEASFREGCWSDAFDAMLNLNGRVIGLLPEVIQPALHAEANGIKAKRPPVRKGPPKVDYGT